MTRRDLNVSMALLPVLMFAVVFLGAIDWSQTAQAQQNRNAGVLLHPSENGVISPNGCALTLVSNSSRQVAAGKCRAGRADHRITTGVVRIHTGVDDVANGFYGFW